MDDVDMRSVVANAIVHPAVFELRPDYRVLPLALEMLALRRMTHRAFGTLMAIEPAIGWPSGSSCSGRS